MNKLNEIIDYLSEDLRATRLGTCFDNNLRVLKVKQNSFDLAKLNNEKLLLFVGGIAEFKLTASSSNNSTYNSSAFNISINAEGSILSCKAAAGFTMETASAHAEKTESIKACLSYRYLGQFFQIQNATENTYFNCLLTDCQNALKDIFEATTPDDKLEKYIEFTTRYGHACVTKLYLGAGSIANIEIETKSTSNSNSSKYGVTAAVSSLYGNASNAIKWANEHKEAGLKGNLKIDSIDYPQNSPTQDWAHALINTYAGKGLELLAKDGAFAELPTPSFEKAPPYPKYEKPERKELPKGEADLSKATQKKIMKDEKFKGTWKEFLKKQKEELEKIDKSKIVEDARKVKKNNQKLKPIAKKNKTSNQEVQLNDITESDWDLGSYLPVGYELTPWTELFPSLKAVISYPSTSNIVFAKIMTFYYTRLQFGQYMQFLIDVGDAYNSDKKKWLENDIKYYFDLCKSFLNDFYGRAETLTEKDYTTWLLRFEARLGTLRQEEHFHNYTIYQAFFEMYDTFAECPFGFTCNGFNLIKGAQWIVREEKETIITQIKSIYDKGILVIRDASTEIQSGLPTLEKAIRFYPTIVDINGNIYIEFVYFISEKSKFGAMEHLHFIPEENTKKDYITLHHQKISFALNEDKTIPLTFLGWNTQGSITSIPSVLNNFKAFGFNDVEDNKIFGVTPMFRNFDFDIPKKFAE